MGSSYIEGVIDSGVNLDTALHIHLTSNLYPPVSPIFVDTCKNAIGLVECEEGDTQIELPNGFVLTANDIVDQLRLEVFINLYNDIE